MPASKRSPRTSRTPPPSGLRVLKVSVRPDERGRITLGDAVKDSDYRVLVNEAGQILLDPVVTLTVPASEAWIWENAGARASMSRAMQQAAKGEFESLGSFAKFAGGDKT